jgi:hypothetical protein
VTARTSPPFAPRCRWPSHGAAPISRSTSPAPTPTPATGSVAVSKAGLAERDAYVLDAMHAHGVPVALAMAGGYANAVADIVDIHYATVALALLRFAGRRVLDCEAIAATVPATSEPMPPASGALVTAKPAGCAHE